MIYAAFTFFIMSFATLLVGASDIVGSPLDIGKTIMTVLIIMTATVGVMITRKPQQTNQTRRTL